MNLLSDSEIANLVKEHESANPERQQQIADQFAQDKQLRDYQAGMDAAKAMYLSPQNLGGHWTPEQSQAAKLVGEDEETAKKRYANISLIAAQKGVPRDQVANVYESLRDSIAQDEWGKPTVTDDEFFSKIQTNFKDQQARDTEFSHIATSMGNAALSDVLEGKYPDWSPHYSGFSQNAQRLGPEETKALRDTYLKSYQLAQDNKDLFEVAKRALATETDRLDFTDGFDPKASLDTAAERISKLPPEQKQTVFGLLTMYAQQHGLKGADDFVGRLGDFAENLAKGAGRETEKLALGSPNKAYDIRLQTAQDLLESGNPVAIMGDKADFNNLVLMKPTGLADAPEAAAMVNYFNSRDITPEERKQLLTQVKQERAKVQVLRELKAFAQDHVDPVKAVLGGGAIGRTFEKTAYMGADMLPLIGLAAVSGGVSTVTEGMLSQVALETLTGGGVVGLGVSGSVYERLRVQHPDMNPNTAAVMSDVVGALTAAGFKLNLAATAGELPFISKAFERLATPTSSFWKRFAIGAGIETAFQAPLFAGQAFIEPVVQEVFHALDKEVPGVQWKNVITESWRSTPETLLMAATLSLFGAGKLALEESQWVSKLIQSPKSLELYAFKPEDAAQIAELAKSGDTKAAESLFREKWQARTEPEIEAAGQRLAEEVQRAKTLLESKETPTMQQRKDGTVDLLDKQGKTIANFPDQESAYLAWSDKTAAELGGVSHAEAMAELKAYLEEKDPQLRIEMLNKSRTLQEALKDGDATPEVVYERMRIAGAREGEKPEDFQVLGENLQQIKEGIRYGVARLYHGAKVETMIEEVAHAKLTRAIETGRLTDADLTKAVDAWSAEHPEFALREDMTPAERTTAIQEAMADMVKAKFFGNFKKLSGLPAAVRAFIEKAAILFKSIFARAATLKRMEAEGKLPENVSDWIAESVGLKPEHDLATKTEQAAGELAGAKFSVERVKEEPKRVVASNGIVEGPGLINFSIRAFHGTPHDFDRFSLDKIGTGEGAQAYGYGLYLAERHETATSYKSALGQDVIVVDGKEINESQLSNPARSAYQAAAIQGVERTLKDWSERIENGDIDPKDPWFKEFSHTLENLLGKDISIVNKGNLYTVDIKAEPHELLDWDKPFEKQSENVKSAIEKHREPLESLLAEYNQVDDLNAYEGKHLYKLIARAWSEDILPELPGELEKGMSPEEAASAFLSSLGVKGIRYLDGGSRGKAEGTSNFVVFDANDIQITHKNGKPVSMAEANATNFSIARKGEHLQRIADTLDALKRNPEERLAIYERAKEKLSQIAQRSQADLDALKAQGHTVANKESAAKIDALKEAHSEKVADLQAQLDKALADAATPKEQNAVRLGFASKRAALDRELSRETAKLTGGTLAAERTLQSLAEYNAVLSAFPPEVRGAIGGFAKLADLKTDKARASFISERIRRADNALERILKNEYREHIEDLLQRSKPKKGESGVRKSMLGPEAQAFADAARKASLLDADATVLRIKELSDRIAGGDTSPDTMIEWGLVNAFGDLPNRSSEQLADAKLLLEETLKKGREKQRMIMEERFTRNREIQSKIVELLGRVTQPEAFKNKHKGALSKAADTIGDFFRDHLSAEQFLKDILPGMDPFVQETFDRLRKADNGAQDMVIADLAALMETLKAAAKESRKSTGKALEDLKEIRKSVAEVIVGRMVANERIKIELAEKIVRGEAHPGKLSKKDIETLREELAALPADTRKEYVEIKRIIAEGEKTPIDMSREDAIQILLSWAQKDVRDKMLRDGWTEDTIDSLRSFVESDPVAVAVMGHLQNFYASGGERMNPVYARMFGMNMPRIDNYAPTRFRHGGAAGEIGPDGAPTFSGSTPGMLVTRVSHSAPIAAKGALDVFREHVLNQAHWVHFAELARDVRAVFANGEVRNSLSNRYGESVLAQIDKWTAQLEKRGGDAARESAWVSQVVGALVSGRVIASLGFNPRVWLMQSDSALRSILAIPARDLFSAFTNPVALAKAMPKVWFSPTVQRRIKSGMNPEMQFLFTRSVNKPGLPTKIAHAATQPMNVIDAMFTTIGSAAVYKSAYEKAIKAGMRPEIAEANALDALDAAIYRFSQPTGFGSKSLRENSSGIIPRIYMLFMSDPRLKSALIGEAAKGLVTGKGSRIEHVKTIVAIEAMALLSQVLANAYRDAVTDDTDEEIWTTGGFARAGLLAPFQGYFMVGSMAEATLSALTKEKFFAPSRDPFLDSVDRAKKVASHLEDTFNAADPDAMLKQWVNITRMMALNPVLAAPAALLNLIKPLVGAEQNAKQKE